jgi:hypothetical protein
MTDLPSRRSAVSAAKMRSISMSESVAAPAPR